MFNNLIESTSHRKEFTRRGSFLFFTTITYAVMLGVSGVVSIYAYDAHLEDQNYEQVLTMLPPEPAPPARTPTTTDRPRSTDNNRLPERTIAMPDVNVPQVVPDSISVTPNKVKPLPPGPVRITGGPDRDFPMPTGGNSSTGSGGSRFGPPAATIVLDEELPPQPPQPREKKIIISKKVLNSEATYLPKPIYPPMARQIRLQGQVIVQVLIDEGGRVISAQPVSGHPILTPEAKKAALQARFTPTMIGDQPMKVSGVITYNFVMQ